MAASDDGTPQASDEEDDAEVEGVCLAPGGPCRGAGVDAVRKRRRRGFVVNTSACTGKSAKDLYSAVITEVGWREQCVASKATKPGRATIYCVMQSGEAVERLSSLGRRSWVTRYIGMPDLCDKGNFARMARVCQDLCPESAWGFNPPTWVLPDQLGALRGVLEKSKKTYIVKPEDGSQGDGIFLVQGLRDLDVKLSARSNKAAVVQRYLERPLLLGGVKFDLRMYVAVIGGSQDEPPRVYLCKEGLARFCTERYEEPTSRNMHQCMAHLTNYSLNKRSDKFEHCEGTREGVFALSSTASKRPLTVALKQIEAECPAFSSDEFYGAVAAMSRTVVAAWAPVLSTCHVGQGGSGEMRCCQLLGFDVMLDEDFRPYLLEVNNSPSLCIDEALPLEPGDPRAERRGGRAGGVREKGPEKVCLCMDMARPHTHQTSMVDLVVKTEAMRGLFRLLEQLQQSVAEPEVDSYIAVNVSEDALFHLLQGVGSVFQRCGGAQKAFHSGTLRRVLGPACGSGGLEKHDLDMLNQRFRSTKFVGRDGETKSDGLRLYDFAELLRQAGARAFPSEPAAAAIARVATAATAGG